MTDHRNRVMFQARVRTFLALPILGAALFGSAGTFRWQAGWIYFAILLISTILPLYGPLRFDVGLIEERLSSSKNAEPWDRKFVSLIGLLSVIELAIPGLDLRFHWSCQAPSLVKWVGAAGVIWGTAGLTWAMYSNRFFSAYVRLQRERHHHVIASGPYRFVRHPGYAAWMFQGFCLPLLFGSWWTLLPVTLISLVFVVRTRLEDNVLREQLDGYCGYARRVRYRLVPGIW